MLPHLMSQMPSSSYSFFTTLQNPFWKSITMYKHVYICVCVCVCVCPHASLPAYFSTLTLQPSTWHLVTQTSTAHSWPLKHHVCLFSYFSKQLANTLYSFPLLHSLDEKAPPLPPACHGRKWRKKNSFPPASANRTTLGFLVFRYGVWDEGGWVQDSDTRPLLLQRCGEWEQCQVTVLESDLHNRIMSLI